MKWLRLYSEALHDPKVQRLPGELFKHWINLLLLANGQEERGTLPDLDTIAFELRIPEAEASAVIDTFVERSLLDRDGERLTPHNWDQRQPKRDAPSTDRTRAFRHKNTRNDEGNTEETRAEHGERALDLEERRSRRDLEEKRSRGDPEQSREEAQAKPAAAVAAQRPPREGTKLNRRLEPEPDFEERAKGEVDNPISTEEPEGEKGKSSALKGEVQRVKPEVQRAKRGSGLPPSLNKTELKTEIRQKDAVRDAGIAVLHDQAFTEPLRARYPALDWDYESEKWLDYITEQGRKGNFKNGWRNWLEKAEEIRVERAGRNNTNGRTNGNTSAPGRYDPRGTVLAAGTHGFAGLE